MAESISQFLVRQQQEGRQQTIGAANVVLGSVTQSPDEVAGDLNLARDFTRSTGNPTPPLPLVSEYRSVFQEAVERERNSTILSSAPKLSDWLRNPQNAALARDDLAGLSYWEGIGNSFARFGLSLPQGYNQWMATGAAQRAGDQDRSFLDIYADERATPMFDLGPLGDSRLIDTAVGPVTDLWGAGMRYLTSRMSAAFGGDQQAAAAYYQQQAGMIANRIAAIPMDETGERYKQAFASLETTGDVAQDLSNFWGTVSADPVGFASFLSQVAVESAPMLAVAGAATAITRNPSVGAAAMGMSSFAMEAGRSPVEFFEEMGIDVSTPEGAMAAISDPNIMRQAVERGVARGLIIGALDTISGGIAGEALTRNPLANVAIQSVVQAALGGAGEAGGQVASGQQFNISEVIIEALAEFVTAPIEVGAVGGQAFLNNQAQARDAEARQAVFQEISGQATNSALRNRMPDAFRQFVEMATANGPVENLFIPAEAFRGYFQSIGVDPVTIVDSLDGVTRNDLETALVTGGDLRIPTATYATRIAGSEHDAFLMENMRFNPDEYTSAQAREFNARAQDAMQEAWEVAEQVRLEAESLRTFEQEIYDTMVERLRIAGRAPEVATTEALLYPAFYRVMAERSGLTTEEFMARYPLPQVRGTLPQGMQPRNVDELNRTLAEARARRTAGLERRGPSLLEFIADRGGINDVGGELRARDAETVRRGRRNLRVARQGFVAGMQNMFGGDTQYGADTVAQAAIEAGYLADDPVANEYRAAIAEGRQVPDITAALWNAIDRELAGEAQYVPNAEADAQAEQDTALNQIEAYLSEIGVSLDDDDAAIREAIEADQAGAAYGQASRPQDISAGPDGRTNLFEQDADRWFANYGSLFDPKSKHDVRVMRRNFVLEALTGDRKAISISPSVAREVARKHPDVPAEVWANLPELLADPDYAFPHRDGGMNFVVEVATAEGEPIVVGVRDGMIRTITPYNNTIDEGGNARLSRVVNSAIDRGGKVYIRDARRTAALEPTAHGSNGDNSQRQGSVSRGANPPYASQASDRRMSGRPRRNVLNRDDVIKRQGRLFYQAESISDRTQTEAFKAWFGDSKVVDENGEPLVVYHGTATEFEAFSKDAPAKHIDLPGFYFTPDESIADRFAASASRREIRDADGYITGYEGARVVPVYLSIQNPAEIDLDDRETGRMSRSSDVAAALNAAIEAGHDGAIIRGWADGSGDVQYVAFSPTQIKSVDNRGTFDPNDPRILNQDARGSIQFPAGGVGNGDTIVRLFETANLSTTLHESGHYFLAVMRDLASRGEANAAGDLDVVTNWWRANAADVARDATQAGGEQVSPEDVVVFIDSGTTGDAGKDMAIDTGMHEQFARAFETYLMEGKAPSVELRSAFEKFRAWLISVYQRLTGLNVQVSDEIRAVFDRMIASDAEIEQAKQRIGGDSPVFATAEQMGLTPEEFSAFLSVREKSEADAKARLMREIMQPIRREEEKAYKAEKAKVRADVERNVNAMRQYRAIEWMGNKRWLGDGQPEAMPDIRLSKDILIERYGEGILKTLPRGRQTVYTVEGGIDPDDAAGWFGFGSGDEMVRAMETAQPRTQAIDAETERLMRELHGDPLNDGTIELRAVDAVHSQEHTQWIAAELKAVIEVAGTGVGMTAKEARNSARQTIARMKVRDAMAANRFLAAERKAAGEAQRLAQQLGRDKVWLDRARRRIETQARRAVRGDADPNTVATAIDAYNARQETTETTYEVGPQTRTSRTGTQYTIPGGERTATSLGYNDLVAAFVDAKRRQLLNHALYMESRAVADEVGAAERFVAKLNKKSTRERIAGAGRRDNAQVDYLSAIDEILERYDFRKMSGAAEQRRGALNAFIESMKLAGRENEIAIPEAVRLDASRRPYKTLPVEELRGVVDSLKNLEHIATRWNKLIDAQNQRELDAVVDDITAAFDANLPKRPPGRVGSRGEQARNSVRQFFDLVLNAGTILREIDGFADFGAAYRNIKSPIDEAMDRLALRRQKAAEDLEGLYAVYSKAERRRMTVREHVPALGYALSKWERIAVALNTGNAGNYQRLTDPKVRGSLTPAQVAAVLGSLDERDAKFVQSVWDYIGSFRQDIAARERRATGVEPEWVEATPVVIGGQTLRGGYYPIKYDPRLSSLARDDQQQDIAQSLQAGRFGKAQTRNGHLKDRAQSSGRDVELDMSVLHRHVNQVIYDLELSEPVSNSWRILQNGRVRSAFIDAGKQADFDALEIWLKDVAEGELKSGDLVGRTARTMKSNFTAAKLAFNISTVMVQVTGLAQSMVVVGKQNMTVGIMQAAANPFGKASEISAKSSFMNLRQKTFNKDIYDMFEDPKMGPVASRLSAMRNGVAMLGFWLMTKVQFYLVDVPTWLAGYRQGLAQFGNDEAKAIAHADAVVKRAQASGLFSDRSAVERGSVSKTARQNDVVRLFTALGSYMFAKFNVAYERSSRASRVIRDEGVSVRSVQEAMSWALDIGFLFTLEAVMYAAIKGRLPDDDDDDEGDGLADEWMAFLAKETGFSVLSTIPGVRDVASVVSGFEGGGAYGAITKELAAPFTQISQGEPDAALIKSIINATGLATGIPSTQINRAVDAGMRSADGEDVAPLEYLLGRSGR